MDGDNAVLFCILLIFFILFFFFFALVIIFVAHFVIVALVPLFAARSEQSDDERRSQVTAMMGHTRFFGSASAKAMQTAAMTRRHAPRIMFIFFSVTLFFSANPLKRNAKPPTPAKSATAQLRLKKPKVSGTNTDKSHKTAAAKKAEHDQKFHRKIFCS